MGSKYAALGRSKALSNVSGDIMNVARTMIMGQQIEDYQYKSAIRKEADESVIDITPPQTVGDMVGQRAMQDKQDIRAIQSTAETRKATAAADQQETSDNKVYEVKNTAFMEKLSKMSPKAANRVYKWADLNGFLMKKDGRVLISGRHLRLGQKMLMEDMEFQQALNKDMLIDSEGRIAKMESLLSPGDADIQNKDKVKLADKDKANVRIALAKEKKNHHYLLNVVNAGDFRTSKQEQVPKRQTKKVPLANNMIQKKESLDGGKTWQNSGVPYSRFAPKGGAGKDVAKADIKRVSDIKRAMATLEKADRVTMLMATLSPKLKGMVGQKIDPQLKAELFTQWNREIAYLERAEGTIPEKYRSTEGDILDLGL